MTFESGGPGDVSLGPEDRAAALGEVKAVLRVVSDDEDALVVAFVEAALGLAERFTGQVLIAREMRAVLAAQAAWQCVGAGPVRAITSVEAIGAIENGDGAVVLGSAAYAVDIDAGGEGWVRSIDAGAAKRIAVTFVAGAAADWAGVPGPLRQGVVLLAAHLFTARDERDAPPAAVTALWRPFRRLALARRVYA
ncbi:head-tail connector protein [Sphingomonas immobilis]|uniref:Phage gp6-like head-tail connector protein n=1 Tax=Sphingomonas immobilis TaxID=3063997 RepID=A0ABT9A1P1_9SPHN|nr:hypothetical protein [Sphingomonas sp. CA1-15]MDO7843743.1 hypothetical protein [Sphingomonas sp. CA1-15]